MARLSPTTGAETFFVVLFRKEKVSLFLIHLYQASVYLRVHKSFVLDVLMNHRTIVGEIVLLYHGVVEGGIQEVMAVWCPPDRVVLSQHLL